MFDTFAANRLASLDTSSTPAGSGGSGGRFVEGDAPATNPSFGDIASYQICGCCARYRGPMDGTDDGQGVIVNSDDRGGFGTNGKPSLYTTDAGAQITRDNLSWATGLGMPAVVTYAFRATAQSPMPAETSGFSQFSAPQIAATLQALSAWSDVANITFNRVSDAGGQYSDNATILLGNYSAGQRGAAAFAYLPGNAAASSNSGNVWVNSSLSYNAAPVQQEYGQLTLLHEIGHAIGLSHPADYNASEGVTITYAASAIYFEDTLQYSVMSYFPETFTGADYRVNGAGAVRYASAPQMDDIAAAQRLYGANTTTRTGDTTYGFNSNAGQVWFSATSATSTLIFAVWDAGGNDTFDFSGYTSNSTIDLRQGAFSSVGGMLGNVSIAVGAVIENAIGGSGSDTIRGNSGNNRITGGGGNDTIDGGMGSDTIVFAGSRSAYTITWNGQVGTIVGFGSTVTVSNVEFLAFTDGTVAAAPTGGLMVGGDLTDETITGTTFNDAIGGLGGNDTISGLDGNDTLDGGSGNDFVSGGNGDDVLVGGLGNDTINGGAGIDIADYSGAGAGVTVNLATGTSSGAAGNDTLSGIENLTGSSFADVLTGDANDNVVRGNGGIDTISGGGGNDVLVAGAPAQTTTATDVIKPRGTANATIATALSVDGRFDLLQNSNIDRSTTIPHATVVATTHGGFEYYAFTVQAGAAAVFDIDNASFDSTLRIFDSAGNELAANDDAASDGGPRTDSMINFTFAAAGTYYVQVARFSNTPPASGTFSSDAPPAGGTYTLHISIPGAAVAPIISVGSTLNGDAGEDRLEGGLGADTLNGGGDNDTLIGGLGDDVIDGGEGTDTAVFTGNRSTYTISTTNGVTTITGADGVDRLTNVERLQFADGLRDINGNPLVGGPINGTDGNDVLTGTSGNDTINGGAGDDVITGGQGDDTIDGGVGTDTSVFSGTISGSTVTTVNGVTTVTGPDGTDTLTNIERLRFADGTLIVGAGGGQYFAGTPGADTITGTTFNDRIEAGAGDDIILGGDGSDVIYGDRDGLGGIFAGNDVIDGGAGIDFLYGDGGNDRLSGGSGVDYLYGGEGADVLIGGAGADFGDGGDGFDTLDYSSFQYTDGRGFTINYYNQPSGLISLTGAGGDAEGDIFLSIERLIGTDFDDTVFGTSITTAEGVIVFGEGGNDALWGSKNADYFNGGAGNDRLSGGDGDDVLLGGEGNDQLEGGNGADTADYSSAASGVTAQLNTGVASNDGDGGTDTFSGIENLTGSAFNDVLIGDDASNLLRGGAGYDVLVGLAGNDVLQGGTGVANEMYGGMGDDLYVVEADGDTIVEQAGEGTDLVQTNLARYRLSANVENMTYVGTAGFEGQGNEGGNVLRGGSQRDALLGFGGDDILIGGAGAANELYGGTGNDYYIVEAADTVIENAGEGIDTVESRLDTFTLRAHVENLVYAGTGDFIGTGNASDNRIEGGIGNDRLIGGAGNDALIGGAGIDTADYSTAAAGVTAQLNTGVASNDGDGGTDTFSGIENLTGSAFNDVLIGDDASNLLRGGAGYDVLVGLAGNDVLQGGTGVANEMYGGMGDDLYVVEADGDTIVEQAGEGTDLVQTNLARYRLSANVENMTYVGTAGFEGQGNEGGNVLRGGAQRDVLLGFGGDDILIGGAGAANELYGGTGNDYYVLEVGDTIVEAAGEGSDSVEARINVYSLGANIENLLFGGTGNFNGSGNSLNNLIVGGAGDDVLRGGGGSDQIQGGAGTDRLVLLGVQANYTITAEGSGWRIVDQTQNRDGSILVTSVEVVEFGDKSTLTLTPPAGTEPGHDDAQVLPGLFDDGGSAKGGHDQPLVQPGSLDDGFLDIKPDTDSLGPQIQPGVFDDLGGLEFGGSGFEAAHGGGEAFNAWGGFDMFDLDLRRAIDEHGTRLDHMRGTAVVSDPWG